MDVTLTDGDFFDCVVVGGCANGVLLQNVKTDADVIELSRPTHIKPVASALQKRPEVIREKDKYRVHQIQLLNDGETEGHLLGIAVEIDHSLSWAFSQLVKGFIVNTTRELMAEGHIADFSKDTGIQ